MLSSLFIRNGAHALTFRQASGLTPVLSRNILLYIVALPFAAHGWEYHAQSPIVSHVASGTQTLSDRMTIDEKCAQLGKLRGFNTITLPGEDKRRVEANRAFSVLIRK
jgi:hypothetical protein